jgi:hypothetical protein
MDNPQPAERAGLRGAPRPGPKLCPKIILEGTRLTHKTDLAFALNEHARIVGPRRYRYHSPLISAEWCAFTNVPWGRGLINFAPDEESRALETYRTWLRLFELQRYYSWIVDRFHVSTQVWQQRAHGRHYDFAWLEDGLGRLGFHVVLCTRRPSSFAAARAARLAVSGNPAQYDDLAVFVDEQERFRAVLRGTDGWPGTRLPLLEVDLSDDDVGAAAERVADWLTTTGGLWATE